MKFAGSSSKIDKQVLLAGTKMKDPQLEQQLLLATIDDRDEGVDVCDSTSPDKIASTAVSPNSRRHPLIPGRQSSRLIGRHPITADVCETIPEESAAVGGLSAENDDDDEERRASKMRQQIVDAHLPPPRRHRKLLPIHHLSLNIRQVSASSSNFSSLLNGQILSVGTKLTVVLKYTYYGSLRCVRLLFSLSPLGILISEC